MNIFEELGYLANKVVDDTVYKEVVKRLYVIENEIKQHPEHRNGVENELLRILREIPMSDAYFILLLSGMIAIFERSQYIELLLEGALYSEEVSLQNLDYIWRNIENFIVKHPQCETENVKELMYRVQNRLYKELRSQVVVSHREKAERNRKRVVVLSGVFLGERHAPSHSALERCVMLREQMESDVYLVAGKEGAMSKDMIPYYKRVNLNIIPEYEGAHIWSYQGHEFKFYQVAEATNEEAGLQKIIDIITEINPYYVVYVGTESYVADIVNEFCPVVAISVTFSKLRNYHTAFSMVGRKVTEEERTTYPCEILEVPFSFELREKERDYTREELAIPQDEFVLAIVGLRLDHDVTDEFLACIEQIEGAFCLFIGCFDSYEEKMKKYPRIRAHSKCTGMITDVIGVLECADLYVNPKRLGGGFSVIEGFHAGIPAVTIHYGDVAAAAGVDFCVEDYEEMKEVICRYQTDKEFYNTMLEKGKQREAYMTNGGTYFKEGIEKMLNSSSFF